MLGSLFTLTLQCCDIWVRVQKGDKREEFYFFPFSDSMRQYLSQAPHSNNPSSKWTALVVAPWKIEPAGTIEHLTSEKGCKHQSEQMQCHFCSACFKNKEKNRTMRVFYTEAFLSQIESKRMYKKFSLKFSRMKNKFIIKKQFVIKNSKQKWSLHDLDFMTHPSILECLFECTLPSLSCESPACFL